MRNLKALIVGTGRCGTVYVSRVLTNLGHPCSHEGIFTPEGVDFAVAKLQGCRPIKNSEISARDGKGLRKIQEVSCESSYLAAPYLEHSILEKTKIIHLVRNPLQVIFSLVDDFNYFSQSSVTNTSDRWQLFIYYHLPILKEEMHPYERACLYYIEWNSMIERISTSPLYYFHRIEDNLEPLLSFLDIEATGNFERERKVNSGTTRTRVKGLNFIPEGEIKSRFVSFSNKYGYDLSCHKIAKIY